MKVKAAVFYECETFVGPIWAGKMMDGTTSGLTVVSTKFGHEIRLVHYYSIKAADPQ